MPSLLLTPGQNTLSNGMFTWFRGNHCKQVLRPFSSSGDTNPIHPLSPESLSQGWHTRIFLWRWTLSPSFRSSSRYLPDNKMIGIKTICYIFEKKYLFSWIMQKWAKRDNQLEPAQVQKAAHPLVFVASRGSCEFDKT